MIFVECDSDKALVKSLGIKRKHITHAFSKGNVCNQLEENTDCKGLIDEDPNSIQPHYIEDFKLLATENGIKQFHQKTSNNFLIMLCPRLENWVLSAAKQANIDISKFSLPDAPSLLHRVINTKIRSFEILLDEIKGSSIMLKTLENFLKS